MAIGGVSVFKRWEVGLADGGQGVLIAYDRGTAEQAAFLCSPKAAREIGRALIKYAREAEHQKSRLVKK